jgi:ssDNA-binding Zn-finger/Zn-ribbon topoisomerase 1
MGLLVCAGFAGASSSRNEVQECSKCGAGMVVRKNSKTGEKFWGCSTFPKCRNSKNYLLKGDAKPSSGNTATSTSSIKNASVIRYHLKRYSKRDFTFEVHENLKEFLPDLPVHAFGKIKGFDSGPDVILVSKKNKWKKAYEYQYAKSYKYFKISESRYEDLKRYCETTGNPAYWVMSTGGIPLNDRNEINANFSPENVFIMPFNLIKKSHRYYLNELKEKYNILNHYIIIDSQR